MKKSTGEDVGMHFGKTSSNQNIGFGCVLFWGRDEILPSYMGMFQKAMKFTKDTVIITQL